MRASEVRTAILTEHEVIRTVLSAVDGLAEGIVVGFGDLEGLREQGLVLHRRLVAHLDFEDRYLIPAVRESDGWGDERARQISEEHSEQRDLLEYILKQIRDRDRVAQLLGRTLRSFVEAVLEDMSREEAVFLCDDLLRDDVVGIDVEAG